MANKTVQLKSGDGDNAFPLPPSPNEQFLFRQEKYPTSGNIQFVAGSYYNITINVPDGYRLLSVGPLCSSGFIVYGYPLTWAEGSLFLKTGTLTCTCWIGIGTSNSGAYQLLLPCVFIKDNTL